SPAKTSRKTSSRPYSSANRTDRPRQPSQRPTPAPDRSPAARLWAGSVTVITPPRSLGRFLALSASQVPGGLAGPVLSALVDVVLGDQPPRHGDRFRHGAAADDLECRFDHDAPFLLRLLLHQRDNVAGLDRIEERRRDVPAKDRRLTQVAA